MKKIAFVALAIFALTFTSCKRDWTCTCTATGGGVTSSASTTINATKKDAEDACNAQQTTVSGTVSVTATCELEKK